MRTRASVRQHLRKWLFQDLHDGLGQKLTYLNLELSTLARQLPSELGTFKRQLQVLEAVAGEAQQQLKTILSSIGAPETPKSWGLQGHVKASVEQFASRTGVPVSLNMVEEPVIWTTPFAGYHIEAIVQESLWNAWRHGGIGHVTVLVKQENDHWQIEIVDDGVGFNPAVRKEGHHGLSIMRERARSIGGKLQVLSKTSQGTKVRLLIPRDERGTTARSARGIRGRRFPW